MTKRLQNMNSPINPTLSREIKPIEELKKESISNFDQPQKTKMFLKESARDFHPSDYLDMVEPHLSSKLISNKNLSEIKEISSNLTGGLTSFFGFESHLGVSRPESDYLLAVSSGNGERETLANLIRNGEIPVNFGKSEEWQRTFKFSLEWADPNSELYDKVLGLWFEFDVLDSNSEKLIPNIFLQIKKTRIDTKKDLKKFKWITKTAIPLLKGKTLSETTKKNLIKAVKNLPKGTSLIHVGTMLSRKKEGVRIVINRIKPKQVIPYLKSVGWSEESEKLSDLLKDLEDYVTRLVLHLNIGKKIDQKIGLECSFSENKYHQETGWQEFLEYLVEKDLCSSQKKEALLSFPGVQQEDLSDNFDMETYMIAPKIKNKNYSSALVRYLSHIKIVYNSDHSLEAKAYPGVRLFGKTE